MGFFPLVISIISLLCICHVIEGEEVQPHIQVSKGFSPKIVGGVEATKNEFPFLIRIQRKKGKSLLCGGAIIREDLILTASHCLAGENPSNLEIVAGDHDTTIKEQTEQVKNIMKTACHRNYNGDNYQNDICLLMLSSNLTVTSAVTLIKLPDQSYVLPETGQVAGWGLISEESLNTEKILRKVNVQIVSNDECSLRYKNVANITSNMICAGQPNKDSCSGDSGSPLICTSNNPVSVVACGIVSFGVGCGRIEFPGVYTRTSKYVDWITKLSADTDAEWIVANICSRTHTDLISVTIMILFLFYNSF